MAINYRQFSIEEFLLNKVAFLTEVASFLTQNANFLKSDLSILDLFVNLVKSIKTLYDNDIEMFSALLFVCFV